MNNSHQGAGMKELPAEIKIQFLNSDVTDFSTPREWHLRTESHQNQGHK
jgi:hypothetical protein